MKTKSTLIVSIIAIAISALAVCLFLFDTSPSIEDTYQKNLQCVVEVRATTGDMESYGTAVIVSDATLVTNFHIVSYVYQTLTYVHSTIEIRFAYSEEYEIVTLDRYDAGIDLAVLVMNESQGRNVKIHNSRVFTGQKVILMGNGNNLGISITTGIISRSEVEIQFNGNLNQYIQIDATSTNGMSGGALLDEDGSLLGIITLRLLDKNGTPIYGYVYVIPVSVVLEFMNEDTLS